MIETITEEELYRKTPQELTMLLYQALEKNMTLAIDSIKAKKFEDANKLLQKCNDILQRLGAGINYEAGIIADQLEMIYQYLSEQTIKANLFKDITTINKNLEIVRMISVAWKNGMSSSNAPVVRNKNNVYEMQSERQNIDIHEQGRVL